MVVRDDAVGEIIYDQNSHAVCSPRAVEHCRPTISWVQGDLQVRIHFCLSSPLTSHTPMFILFS